MTRVFVSADLPETTGRLASITQKIADKGLNIKGLVADRDEVRFLVDDPDAVRRILKDEGLSSRDVEVFEVTLANRPGALARVMNALKDAGVQVHGVFGFTAEGPTGHLYMDVDDVEKATAAIETVPERTTVEH